MSQPRCSLPGEKEEERSCLILPPRARITSTASLTATQPLLACSRDRELTTSQGSPAWLLEVLVDSRSFCL